MTSVATTLINIYFVFFFVFTKALHTVKAQYIVLVRVAIFFIQLYALITLVIKYKVKQQLITEENLCYRMAG